MPILVTGAAGFAGSHLLQHLADDGVRPGEIVAWARSSPPAELAGLATWQRLDLLEGDRVRDTIGEIRPSAVYHLAGSPHVAESWRDTTTPLASNVMGTHHLFDALRRAGDRCRVVVTGSAAVYARSLSPITEQHPVAPSSPYALSKLAQEELGLRAIAEDGVDVILTRSFNHTGPRQSPAFVAPSMARQIALIERGAAQPVIKVGNLDASRDLTDVRDIVRAYTSLMTHGHVGTIYNVASGIGRTIRSVLDGLIHRARVEVRVETDPLRIRPVDVPILVGDPTRLQTATGWTPAIPFERTLDDLLDYWRGVV